MCNSVHVSMKVCVCVCMCISLHDSIKVFESVGICVVHVCMCLSKFVGLSLCTCVLGLCMCIGLCMWV